MSAIDPRLRRLSDFSDPDRAIPQLEQNVDDALARVAVQALPVSTPTSKTTSGLTAVLGQTVVVVGTVPVVLPTASRINAGQRVTVEVQSGSATVTTTGGTVQGATSDALSTVGRYEYESDGAGGWWRPPSSSGAGLTLTNFIQDVGKGTGGHFTITGSGLTAGKNVLVVQTAQPIPSKGNAQDEIEMDAIDLNGYVVNATTIQVYWHATGIVVGDYAFAYQQAA